MKARNIAKTASNILTQLKDPNELVKQVEDKLIQHKINYRLMPHEPEGNCEKVSLLRGNPVHAAAKALLLNIKISNTKNTYVLSILPGDKKVDFKEIAGKYQAKSASMAEPTKVGQLLECEIGRVPPFSFNADVGVIVDEELIKDNEKIYFSPGRLDLSIEMLAKDYQNLILQDNGKIFKFSVPAESVFQTGNTLFNAEKPADAAPALTDTFQTNLKI